MTIFSLFFDPDPYEGDPTGFAVNQIMHFALVGALPVYLGAPVLIVALLIAAWEIAQVAFAGGEAWDSLEDLSFVLAGALAVLWWPMAIVALTFLAAGTARRLAQC